MDFLSWLQQHGIPLLMRVASTGFLGEITQAPLGDSWVTVRITPQRAHELHRQGTPVPVGTELRLRVVKFALPSGEIETVITDLASETIPTAAMPALSCRRWGLETHDDDFKYKFEVENFSGQTPSVREPDLPATVWLSNLASVAEHEAHAEALTRLQATPHKYDEYRINHNILIGKMKDHLIRIALIADAAQRGVAFQRLLRQLARNLIAIRPGRVAPRNKTPRRNKYSQNRRRCL